MEYLRWHTRPELTQPVMLAAFSGWNDAGDAASSALEWFVDRWDLTPFADIDPEEFYDFTSTRPEVRMTDEGRVIDWPSNEFLYGKLPGSDQDVVVLLGVEPQLKWRTFTEAIVEVAHELDVSLVVTLGALLAEVPHSRPVNVAGTAYDTAVVERLELAESQYEGPTGIVGVMHSHCRDAGLTSASLWATVPTYVPGSPSPKATLALVNKTAALFDVGVTTTDLEIATASYERQIDELVADDEETQAYVAALERRHDEALQHGSPEELIAEVERFLRDRDGD